MEHVVSLVRQPNYDIVYLEDAIRRAVELAGFDLPSVLYRKVLLKPNMLGAYPVEKIVTTHPEFVAAAGRVFKKAGAKVWVGDSPNGVHGIDEVWKVTGIGAVCDREGFVRRPFEEGGSRPRRGYMISSVPQEADLIVNLPKFKTHSLTLMTLAAKNMFGCVSGIQKTKYHRDYPSPEAFSRQCVRIAEAIKPELSIVDGIVAMEGNGPSNGTPVNLGAIVAGHNMHAVDWICCRMVGLDPTQVYTVRAAIDLGAWTDTPDISTRGDREDDFDAAGFVLPVTFRTGAINWWLSRKVTSFIWGHMTAQPRISHRRCRMCGMCVGSCPVKAISWDREDEPPALDEERCIQCFCCHEVCPHGAVDIRRSLPLRIAQWLGRHREPRR